MANTRNKVPARCLRCESYRLTQALKANDIAPENLVALARLQSAPAPSQAGLKPDHPLTARQLEILRLLSREHSIAEIARKLGIKESTVSSHISRVCEKLEVPCCRLAVAEGFRRGYVE